MSGAQRLVSRAEVERGIYEALGADGALQLYRRLYDGGRDPVRMEAVRDEHGEVHLVLVHQPPRRAHRRPRRPLTDPTRKA